MRRHYKKTLEEKIKIIRRMEEAKENGIKPKEYAQSIGVRIGTIRYWIDMDKKGKLK